MTVCVAALCESGKAAVVAADRMFTHPGLCVEYETDERKIDVVARRCVALAAGSSVHATEVLHGLMRNLGGNPNPAFDQVVALLQREYAQVRSRKIWDGTLFAQLGLDFERHQAVGMTLATYLEKQTLVFQQMMTFCQNFNLGVDFLLVGLDDTGAYLTHVANPGITGDYQKLGHAAIGSGWLHAMTRLALAGQSRQRGLPETLAEVYRAKRISEVAPGVGKATDVAVLDTGGVWFCPPPLMEELEAVFQATTAAATTDLGPLRTRYEELRGR